MCIRDRIITNQTPFYGESGGQVGDAGEIVSGDFKFEVTDVQKKLGDLIVHYGKVLSGSVKIKDSVEMKINEVRRNNTRLYLFWLFHHLIFLYLYPIKLKTFLLPFSKFL